MAITNGADRLDVLQADRLAAAAVVGDGHHANRDSFGANACDQPLELGRVEVSLERMARSRLKSFVDDQVDGFCTGFLDVCAGGIEVVVARDDLAGPADQLEQDTLAGTPLMRRQDMRHPGQFEEDRLEVIPAPPSGVRLVGAKHSGPLRVAHRRGAAIGQEVNQDVLGGNLKRIEVGVSEDLFALFRRREPDRLDHFDLERLDDCFHSPPHSVHWRSRTTERTTIASPEPLLRFINPRPDGWDSKKIANPIAYFLRAPHHKAMDLVGGCGRARGFGPEQNCDQMSIAEE